MKIVPTRVDTHIWVAQHDLPSGASWLIKDSLTFDNEAKKQARKEHIRGWEEMPDRISLWRDVPGTDKIILPRGFAQRYQKIIESLDSNVEWEDQRIMVLINEEFKLDPIDVRPYQNAAIKKMLYSEQGIYEAPPGAGKTHVVLEAIRRANQRALIIVDKSNIAEQWRERARTFLGAEIGLIGDNVWDEKDITVALQQTLWSRRAELQHIDFYDNWGFVVMDEAHHVTAETYQRVIQRFPAYYRFGISATPDRHGWTFPIALAALGPVCCRTTKEELHGTGVLMRPEVHVVHTPFNFAFRSTSVTSKGYRRSNNYHQMLERLVESEERNRLILDRILREPESCHLVVSKRLNHLHTLSQELISQGFDPQKVYMLTGAESRLERSKISHAAADGACVIFSTIADEALDIPRLDRIHLIWPQRNPSVVRQQIGRIERVHPEKTKSIIYDYYDGRIGVLKNQFMTRLNDVYKKEELALTYENQPTSI